MAVDYLVLQNQALALFFNVLSWALSFVPSFLKSKPAKVGAGEHRAISLSGPGGLDRLESVALKDGVCTVGYNVPPFKSPFTPSGLAFKIPEDCVILNNKAFSVNYGSSFHFSVSSPRQQGRQGPALSARSRLGFAGSYERSLSPPASLYRDFAACAFAMCKSSRYYHTVGTLRICASIRWVAYSPRI